MLDPGARVGRTTRCPRSCSDTRIEGQASLRQMARTEERIDAARPEEDGGTSLCTVLSPHDPGEPTCPVHPRAVCRLGQRSPRFVGPTAHRMPALPVTRA